MDRCGPSNIDSVIIQFCGPLLITYPVHRESVGEEGPFCLYIRDNSSFAALISNFARPRGHVLDCRAQNLGMLLSTFVLLRREPILLNDSENQTFFLLLSPSTSAVGRNLSRCFLIPLLTLTVILAVDGRLNLNPRANHSKKTSSFTLLLLRFPRKRPAFRATFSDFLSILHIRKPILRKHPVIRQNFWLQLPDSPRDLPQITVQTRAMWARALLVSP